MKFLTIEELSKMEEKEFKKLYYKKLEEMEKSFDREKYFLEERSDVIELLKLKVEEFDNFLKNEKAEDWVEFNNTLEYRFYELLKIYEIYLLGSENHLREMRLVEKMLENRVSNIKF